MDLNQLLTLHRTYKSLGRLRQIVAVLSRHGLSQFFQTSPLAKFIPLRRRFLRALSSEDEAVPLPRRIRQAMEELGPTFVKLGQMLSMRPDLVPPGFVEEFQRLQDAVNPLPYDQLKPVFLAELGKDAKEVFATFTEKPIASASIAQVHDAVLPSGERVVVKLQRPDIEKTIELDLEILALLADLLMKYFPALEVLNPAGVVEEFSRAMRRELDFRLEANNMDTIRANFTGMPMVRIPKLVRELSGRRVIVMERIDGVKVTDLETLRQWGLDPVALAGLGADIVIKQVLKDGVFHGDLHAGNILVTRQGEVALLDFGVLGRMDKKLTRGIAMIFVGLMEQEFGVIAEEILDLCQPRDYTDIAQFERDIRNTVLPHMGLSLSQLNVGIVLLEVFGLAFKYRIRVPQDLFLLARSLVTIEGIGRALDPKFDVLEVGSKYTKDLVQQQLDPEMLRKEALVLGRTYLKMAGQFPYQFRAFANRALTDGIRVDVSDRDRDWILKRQERAAHGLGLGIVIAALLGSSTVLYVMDSSLRVGPIPVLPALGAAAAAFLGLFFIAGMLPRGRHR
ncbi:MAG: hypothetical protein HYT87_18550 [Nitrospirae bacterium]|nr:hypothetical protein [Nitrospirota bacterium]